MSTRDMFWYRGKAARFEYVIRVGDMFVPFMRLPFLDVVAIDELGRRFKHVEVRRAFRPETTEILFVDVPSGRSVSTAQAEVARMTRIDRVAEAVDEVTRRYGLSKGEAIYAFTGMLQVTLRAAISESVRQAMTDAIVEALRQRSVRPLIAAGIVSREQIDPKAVH